MANLEQHYESQANGTNVSVANSTTYGDAAASRVDAINGTVTYSTDTAMHGSRSIAMNMTTYATSCTMDVGIGNQNVTSLAARAYMKLTAPPTAPVRLMQLRSVSGTNAEMGGINVYPDNTVAAMDVNGGVLYRSSSSTQILSPSTWYRMEMLWKIAPSTGSYKMAVYVGDSTSPWFSYTSTASYNTGSANIAEVRIGKTSNTGTLNAPWYFDDFAISPGATSFIGPYSPNGPSIATALTPGFLQLDATGSAAVGSGALSYSISPSDGVLQSPNGVFYIPQGANTAAYTLSVTEQGGGTTSQPVTIPALTSASSSQTTVMIQKFLSGAWR